MNPDQVTGKDGQSQEGQQSNAEQPKGSQVQSRNAKAKADDVEEVYKLLKEPGARVVLAGDAGTGKTWLAREVTKLATVVKGSFHMSLWISVKEKFDDHLSLFQSIARQLAIPTSANVWEDVDYGDAADDDTTDEKKKEKYVDDLILLKEKTIEKLNGKIEEMYQEKNEEKQFLLLVLDSEGVVKTQDYDGFVEELTNPSDPNVKTRLDSRFSFKALITARKSDEEGSITWKPAEVVEIQPLSGNEAATFLKNRVGDEVSKLPKFEAFCDAFKKRSKVLPAEIIMLAEALKQIAKDGSNEAKERAFDNILKHADKDDPKPLLQFAYDKLSGDCLIDCFWHSWNNLGKHGAFNYNELITHWMLEGHLDLSVGLKKAYDEAYHHVLMELIDRGMLKMREGNLIVLEGATLDLDDRSCRGLYETSKLGLASVLEGENRKVFERMAPDEGMMKTVRVDKKGESVSSLLIDGSYLCREVPEAFFQKIGHLKVLSIFNPRLTSLPESISKMEKLLVLVLRDCYLLNDNMKCIENLKELIVLEISGALFLKELSDYLFVNMKQLRSLNLSAVGITSLPASLSQLTELRRLIIRQCSSLKELPKLANLKSNLEVIDISGCSSLIKIQEKSFRSFEKLQFIDFSGTKVEKLPIVQTLKNLKIILAKGCDHLSGLRLMKHLPSLKVLDVSGATKVKEIQYDSFDDTHNLRILDLSETDIRFLPDKLSEHLCDLRLRGCSKLEKLPKTLALTDLESLDLSNASSLKEIPNEFFENLPSLQSLNLSNTKVETLPSLSRLQNLHHLILKGCLFTELPELEKLTSLVELDLSGCEKLKNLPSLLNLKSLETINLSGCKALSEIGQSVGEKEEVGQSVGQKEEVGQSAAKKEEVGQSAEQKQETGQSAEQKQEVGQSAEQKQETGQSVEQKTESGQSAEQKQEVGQSAEQKQETGQSAEPKQETGQSAEQKPETGQSAEQKQETGQSAAQKQETGQSAEQKTEISPSAKPKKDIQSFQHMSWLQVLNVSETQIPSLPSLPNPSKLRSLVLRNCTKINQTPGLEFQLQLEELDLRGTSSLKDIKAESLSNMAQLQTLKLSKTALERMQSSLSALTKLEVLDLSGEDVESLPSNLDSLTSLRKLLLSGCSSLKQLPSLNSCLEVLDLSGTEVMKLGEQASNLTHLKRLHLPEKLIEEFKGERVNCLPLEVSLDRCCISEPSQIPEGDKKPSIVVRGTTVLKSLKENPKLLERIGQSISSVQSLETRGTDEDHYDDSRKQIFGDIYSKIRKLRFVGKDGEILEIRGFDDFPTDIEVVLGQAKYIFLVENQFLKMPDSLKIMKGCWLERCNKMESIFTEADLEMGRALEILWISNLLSLKSVYHEKVQSLSFGNLKNLYIDCCPALETVFSSGQLPENLETLQIMFCDNLKSLFRAKESAKSEAPTTTSEEKEGDTTSSAKEGVQTTSAAKGSDKEMHTTGSTDKKLQAMVTAKKEEQTMISTDKQAQTMVTAKKEEQTMISTDKQAQTQISRGKEELQTTSRSNLKHLHISYCPMLETVFPTAQLPKSLEVLRVKFCGKLRSLSRPESISYELPNLHTLQLSELPAWTANFGLQGNILTLKKMDVSPNSISYELPNLHTLQLSELPAWTANFGLQVNILTLKKMDVSPNIRLEKRLRSLQERLQSKSTELTSSQS